MSNRTAKTKCSPKIGQTYSIEKNVQSLQSPLCGVSPVACDGSSCKLPINTTLDRGGLIPCTVGFIPGDFTVFCTGDGG